LNAPLHSTDLNLPPRFCALEYSAASRHNGSPSAGSVILIVVRDENDALQFLVHPQWSSVVAEDDRGYIHSLLEDFIARAATDPDALFQQLCSLAVGPLTTHQIGAGLGSHPNLEALSATFVRIFGSPPALRDS
jgi:hypothetical protein